MGTVWLLVLALFCLSLSSFAERSKKRILVVTIDHRELDSELRNASHQSLSAAINYNYAKLHGYDYVYIHPTLNETRVRRDFGLRKKKVVVTVDPSADQQHESGGEEEDHQSAGGGGSFRRRRKQHPSAPVHGHHLDDAPTAFHPGLKEFRGSSWCRLPTLWHVIKQYEGKYDYLFVIDSDLVISAVHQNVTVEQKLQEWQSKKGITWGPKELSKAGIIFFPNSPFGNWEPATGVLLIQPTPMAAAMIKEWWDFEWPEKAFSLMYEQDVLWRVYQWTPQSVFTLNQQNAAMVQERQFPVDMSVDEWCLRKAWICHVSGSWAKDRNRLFHRILHSEFVQHHDKKRLSSDTRLVATFFKETIAKIVSQEVQFDVVRAAVEMEKNGGPRKKIGIHVPQHSEEVGTSSASSASPTVVGTAAPKEDPEERNNEFHNLNPSEVEEPSETQWSAFSKGVAAFVEKRKSLKKLVDSSTPHPHKAELRALYENLTLGRISSEKFERVFQALMSSTKGK